MELRRIRYFIAVAETGSLTAAARRLGMAQPPLSVQMRRLETEVGVKLLERAGRGVRLTAAGQRFLEGARRITKAAEESLAALQDEAAGRLGAVRVGVVGPYLPARIVKRIGRFRRKVRGVRLVFEPMGANRDPVTEGVDCMLGGWPQGACPARSIGLLEGVLGFMMARKHRIAARERVCVSDLIGERIILPEGGCWDGLADVVKTGLGAVDGVRIDRTGRDSVESEWLVASGMGIGVVWDSGMATSGSDARVVAGDAAFGVRWLYVPSGRGSEAEKLFREAVSGVDRNGHR